jgi:hypothetical protein
MRPRFICGCGYENYNLGDWLSHLKHAKPPYGVVLSPAALRWYRFKRGLKLFLRTRIVFKRSIL